MSKPSFLSQLLQPRQKQHPRKTKQGNNIGILGLGIIGSRVAKNLRSAGNHVWVWSRTPQPTPNFLASPKEVVEHATLIHIFVNDGKALHDVLREIAPKLTPKHTVINSTTVSIEETLEAQKIVEKVGANYIDAPFTGSKNAAEAGELVYYVGGDQKLIQSIEPILEASGRLVVPVGKVGDATAIKLATNILTATTVAALGEATAILRANETSLDAFELALKENLVHSAALDFKLKALTTKNFEPHFSLKNMAKDMRAAQAAASKADFQLPVVDTFLKIADNFDEETQAKNDFAILSESLKPNKAAQAPAPKFSKEDSAKEKKEDKNQDK
ncbi:MAG: NAD(P)-dependent oxidoreductase [Chthoniobacterales bacterium]